MRAEFSAERLHDSAGLGHSTRKRAAQSLQFTLEHPHELRAGPRREIQAAKWTARSDTDDGDAEPFATLLDDDALDIARATRENREPSAPSMADALDGASTAKTPGASIAARGRRLATSTPLTGREGLKVAALVPPAGFEPAT